MQGEFGHLWEIEDSDFTWKTDLQNLPHRVAKFLINSPVNTVPTTDNLVRWGKYIAQSCDQCGNWENMADVLLGCPVALDQGHFTWRHHSVLSQVERFINQTI